MTCDLCERSFPGLSYVIPSEVWVVVSPTRDVRGSVCPWCASEKVVAAGLPPVKAQVHLLLAGFDGTGAQHMTLNEAISRYKEKK